MAFCTIFAALFITPAMQGADCYVHFMMALDLFMDKRKIKATQDLCPDRRPAVCWFGALSAARFAQFSLSG